MGSNSWIPLQHSPEGQEEALDWTSDICAGWTWSIKLIVMDLIISAVIQGTFTHLGTSHNIFYLNISECFPNIN